MAETTEFELVSPERLLISRPVEMVIVPGAEGNLGVLPRHAPVIATVRPGVIKMFAQRSEPAERIFVAGGFAEVTGDRCTVLAEDATPVEDLNRAEIEQSLRNLREDLADAKSEEERGRVEQK